MDQYMEVIKKSKNFPRDMCVTSQSEVKLYPVSPDNFEFLDEEVIVKGSAIDAVCYVQSATEEYRKEYTLVLYGERRDKSITCRDYSFAEGQSLSASFNKEQLYLAKETYKKRRGEVIYAHSHVARGISYKCFSVSDLVFLVKQAMQNNRDVYAMLITKEGVIPIKYSIIKNEFFRLSFKIA